MVTTIDKDIFLWLLVSHLYLQVKKLFNKTVINDYNTY